MSACLGLFHAKKLRNCIYCIFMFPFFVWLFLKSLLEFFAHGTIKYEYLNRTVWLLDGSPTDTTTWGHDESGSNDNEGVLHTPQISGTGASPSDAI